MTLPADKHMSSLFEDGPAAPALIQQETGNQLLRCMDPADFALLQPFATRVPLAREEKLASAGAEIGFICFPEGAVAGFLDVLDDGRKLALGIVGREGFIGWPLLMGNDRWPYDVEVRAETSTAIRIDGREFLAAVGGSMRLRELLLRFAGTFMAQMGRTIVSNLIHPIERRTARWILLYHDRVDGDEIAMTHEELSLMLGVRRASVTDALHVLEGEQAIRNMRRRVIVRDRGKLQVIAGESYGFAEAEYARLIAPLGALIGHAR